MNNEFEKIENELEIIKETEKAICVKVCDGYYETKYTDVNTYKNIWIPKSVSKIENNKLIAIKGWFSDKNGNYRELVTKEAVQRFEDKYCVK